MRNLVLALVHEQLLDAQRHRLLAMVILVGPLALDHHQGNAVDEEHNIRTSRLVTAPLLHRKLVGDVVDVALGMLPVDVVEAVALAVAVDGLGEAGAQGDQLVEALVGGDEALERLIDQLLHCLADVAVAEGMLLAFEQNLIVLAQPRLQHAGEDDVAFPPAAQGQGIGRREVVPAHVDEQLQGRDLGADLFKIGVGSRQEDVLSKTVMPPASSCERKIASLQFGQIVAQARRKLCFAR